MSEVARPCSGLASALHANATPPTTPQYKQYPVYSVQHLPPPYTLSIDRVTLIYTPEWSPASSGRSVQSATPDILALNPDYIRVHRQKMQQYRYRPARYIVTWTDLCEASCAAARATVAWISYHNTNICTASPPCEPCKQEVMLCPVLLLVVSRGVNNISR